MRVEGRRNKACAAVERLEQFGVQLWSEGGSAEEEVPQEEYGEMAPNREGESRGQLEKVAEGGGESTPNKFCQRILDPRL